MTEATAKVIEQTVSGQVPIKINREIPVPCNENAIIPSKDLGPVTTASRSMLQEPDEQPSKNVCLDTVSDEYLDLMHALSPSSDEEEAQNRNLLGEHTEDLKNDFVEELTTIQQEINRPYTIDDECCIEEQSIFVPPCFDGTEDDSYTSTESTDNKPLEP